MWADGKRHGLGIHDGRLGSHRGLWEEGTLVVKCYTAQDVEYINAGMVEVTFSDGTPVPGGGFSPPAGFEEELKRVIEQCAAL